MDRYQRVEKPREEAAIGANEIRNTAQGRTRNYITYALALLQVRLPPPPPSICFFFCVLFGWGDLGVSAGSVISPPLAEENLGRV